jgi:hypothetical protein
VLSLTVVSSSTGSGPKITASTVLALQDWVAAVNTHTPGRADASVATVSALSFEARKDLNAGMGLFFSALMSKRVFPDSEAEKRVAAIGRAVSQNPGADAFLQRAVVLHSDAAAYGDLYPVQPAGSEDVSPPGIREFHGYSTSRTPMNIHRDAPESPLLANKRIILGNDGQVLGEVAASWNWPFARSLLDLLPPRPADDPFVGAWYHATTTYMFANGLYGEATPHLQRAAAVLPDDARILFDRACYAEILGLPMHQVLLSDVDVPRNRSGAIDWTGRHPSTEGRAAGLSIPRANVTNAEGERLFRRALQVDPSFVEARVRLARLLDLRKRHEEAAAELKTALAANPTGMVAFYAHLFAGRAAQALGGIDEAARHYQNASALFPDAQSALLASSRLALLGSDVPAALAPVQRLGAASAAFTADPWWQYHFGAGRDADDLLNALWASVPR